MGIFCKIMVFITLRILFRSFARFFWSLIPVFFFFSVVCWTHASLQGAQAAVSEPPKPAAAPSQKTPSTPEKVDIKPTAGDYEIQKRLESILKATGWFRNPRVEVKDGVVFLYGETSAQDYRAWAEKLAGHTQDTVAVVNHMNVPEPSIWDFTPVMEQFRVQWRQLLQALPSLLIGIGVLIFAYLLARGAHFFTKYYFLTNFDNQLLQRIISWSVSGGIFLMGLYFLFHLMGLTAVALTVIGGTGLIGIILGIAFREITENLLASIVLSINNPFYAGDLIEISGVIGYVQMLTIRATILITLDGSYVQIPNSVVYKSNIRNYTSNPNHREEFTVDVCYDCPLAYAQDVALKVLGKHPAVLNDPEPWVLVDSFGAAAMTLKVYFWLDANKHSWLKVRSSVIRLLKAAFHEKGIAMPSAAAVAPPAETSVSAAEVSKKEDTAVSKVKAVEKGGKPVFTAAEGKLESEAENMKEQADQSRAAGEGANLLKSSEAPVSK